MAITYHILHINFTRTYYQIVYDDTLCLMFRLFLFLLKDEVLINDSSIATYLYAKSATHKQVNLANIKKRGGHYTIKFLPKSEINQ